MPVVILSKVYLTIKRVVGGVGGDDPQVGHPMSASQMMSSMEAVVAAVQALAALDEESGHASDGETSGSDWDSVGVHPVSDGVGGVGSGRALEGRWMGEDGGGGGEGSGPVGGDEPLLEACCLLRLAERFPPAFLDEDAVAGLLLAADALDAVCIRSLSRRARRGRGESPKQIGGICSSGRTALVEAVTALRSLFLRLGLALPPSSPLLQRFSPGDTLLRVTGAITMGGTGPLLRASAALLPFLAERCVGVGQTDAALRAVARLGLTRVSEAPVSEASSGGRGQQQQQTQNEGRRGQDKQLVLLHGVLSGFVAGESRRLAAAAAAAWTGEDSDVSEDDGLPTVAPSALTLAWPSGLDQRLFATVSHLVGCLPTAETGPLALPLPPVSPSLLFVWGDALRLSFLGADAQRLVFAARVTGRCLRSRSQWVNDSVVYLSERAAAVAKSAARAEVDEVRDDLLGDGVSGARLSEQAACCHLLRAVCGCSHLLEPPLPRSEVRGLVEACLSIVVAGENENGANGRDGSGRSSHSNHGEGSARWRTEKNLLQTAFCLLVQHASEDQLREIVAVLLETLETTEAVSGGGGGGLHNAAPHGGANLAAAAVTLVRLTTQAGRGAAFKAVMPDRALSLVAALCRQLRGDDNRAGDDEDDRNGFGGGCESRGTGDGLRNATGALDALDGLLSRQPYASVTARVVSVILGSVEPATRAALRGAEGSHGRATAVGSSGESEGEGEGRVVLASMSPGETQAEQRHWGMSEIKESWTCFRSCCHLVGTLLQHYARKIFSCTPPFASVCRSLLRLFFCLAAPAPTVPATVAKAGDWADGSSEHLVHSLEEQTSAAAALSRVLEQFVPHKEVLKKYAAFYLLEYVSLAGSIALEPAPRAALLAGVFAVIDACTRREMRQLHGLLGALPTGQEVFRSLHEEYQRRHKYTGKM